MRRARHDPMATRSPSLPDKVPTLLPQHHNSRSYNQNSDHTTLITAVKDHPSDHKDAAVVHSLAILSNGSTHKNILLSNSLDTDRKGVSSSDPPQSVPPPTPQAQAQTNAVQQQRSALLGNTSKDLSLCDPSLTSSQTTPADSGTDRQQGKIGIDQWLTWLGGQSHDGEAARHQVTAKSFLRYLNTVILPLELSASDNSASTQTTSAASRPSLTASTSLIRTHIVPILELWQEQQEQEREHEEEEHEQEQGQRCNTNLTETSSLTSSSNVSAPADKVMTLRRQQDHLQRLIQLERSHRDTALVISQLQDKVRRLSREKSPHRDQNGDVDHVRHGTSQRDLDLITTRPVRDYAIHGGSKGPTAPSSYPCTKDPGLDERQLSSQHRPQRTWSPTHRHRYSERNRADDLIAAIAKGLEEFHSQSLHGHLAQEHGDIQARAQAIWSRDEGHTQELPFMAYPHLSRRHAGFQQEDFLVSAEHERAVPTRKRSSSTGPGSLVKESIKQARSCSPIRPRASSGTAPVDGNLGTASIRGSSGSVGHHHAQSQPPSSALVPHDSVHYVNPSSGNIPEPMMASKEYASTTAQHDAPSTARVQMDYYAPEHHQHHKRSSHGHNLSYTPHHERSASYLEEEYLPYHQQTAHHGYRHPEEAAASALTGLHGAEHHYAAYGQSTASAPYRGGHTKNQGSLSSQYSSSQHQYQRDEVRTYHGYDQQHLHNSNDHLDPPEEEDVKPLIHHRHKQQQHQQEQDQLHYHHHHQQQHHHQHYHSRQDAASPIYIMNRQVNTVPELWKEWTVGLGPGSPSIRQLEAQYGPSWRTSSSAANFFSRRLRIINEIQRMIDFEGLTEEEAVDRLEARREQGVVVPGTEGVTGPDGQPAQSGGMSLHRLSEILRKKQL